MCSYWRFEKDDKIVGLQGQGRSEAQYRRSKDSVYYLGVL